jgi:acyl-[acyl carrier protein]--UDP-N-acetylglucosamine O-acyltransferase
MPHINSVTNVLQFSIIGRHSVVGIASHYKLDHPRFEPRWEEYNFLLSIPVQIDQWGAPSTP